MTLSESVDIRAMVVIQGQPEEIAKIFSDYQKRPQWDLSCISAVKAGGVDHIKVSYEKQNIGGPV